MSNVPVYTLHISSQRLEALSRNNNPNASVKAYKTPQSDDQIVLTNSCDCQEKTPVIADEATTQLRLEFNRYKLDNSVVAQEIHSIHKQEVDGLTSKLYEAEKAILHRNQSNAILVQQNKRLLEEVSESRKLLQDYQESMYYNSLTALLKRRFIGRYGNAVEFFKYCLDSLLRLIKR